MTTTAAVGASQRMMFVLNHATTTEAVSNGVWSSILQRYFPQPRFIIAPEQNNGVGGRPDLTVFYVEGNVPNTTWHAIFTLEGKTPGNNINLNDIAQAANYVANLGYSTQLNGRRFGMLVAGQQVVLMVNNGGVVNQTTQWNRADADIFHYNPPQNNNWNIWTIQNQANTVDGFLADFAKPANFP